MGNHELQTGLELGLEVGGLVVHAHIEGDHIPRLIEALVVGGIKALGGKIALDGLVVVGQVDHGLDPRLLDEVVGIGGPAQLRVHRAAGAVEHALGDVAHGDGTEVGKDLVGGVVAPLVGTGELMGLILAQIPGLLSQREGDGIADCHAVGLGKVAHIDGHHQDVALLVVPHHVLAGVHVAVGGAEGDLQAAALYGHLQHIPQLEAGVIESLGLDVQVQVAVLLHGGHAARHGGGIKADLAEVHQHLGQLGALGGAGGIELVLAAGQDAQSHRPLHAVLGPVGHRGGVGVGAQIGVGNLSPLGLGVVGKDLAQLLPGHVPLAAEGALTHAGGEALILGPGGGVGIPLAGHVVEGSGLGDGRTAGQIVQGLVDHAPGHSEVGAEGVAAGAVHDALFGHIGDGGGVPGVRSHIGKDGRGLLRGQSRQGHPRGQGSGQGQRKELFRSLHVEHTTFSHSCIRQDWILSVSHPTKIRPIIQGFLKTPAVRDHFHSKFRRRGTGPRQAKARSPYLSRKVRLVSPFRSARSRASTKSSRNSGRGDRAGWAL